MITDGKKIAEDIYSQIKTDLSQSGRQLSLSIFTCDPNPETKKYLKLKQAKAAALGVDMVVVDFHKEVTFSEIESVVEKSVLAGNGIIVQLPFPSHIDVDSLLEKIPAQVDVDVMNYQGGDGEVLPPVVGAIKEIAVRHNIDFAGKQVAVVGHGRLVGAPAALWAKGQGAIITVIDKGTENAEAILRESDIIISGAGSPGLITPDKIKEGAVLFDAGTSEEGGVMRGDADPDCATKCSLFTPVPGGIGPITIAVLLRNLLILSRRG